MNLPDGEWVIEPISNDLIQAEKVLSTLIEYKTNFQEVKIIAVSYTHLTLQTTPYV